MSYEIEKKKIGRQACTVVELVLDFCQLQYGVAPCTASIPTTGAQKCFNTRVSCQDPTDYAPGYKSYRFSTAKIRPPDTAMNIIGDNGVQFAPTIITPGQGLGVRASVTVTLQDFTVGDVDTDPYFRERSYYPQVKGTFFGKLLARNPYYQNRVLRIYSGFLVDGNFDYRNADVRTYLVQEIAGPDKNYKVTITAKDVLKLADDKRAQAPIITPGILLASIIETTLAFTIQPAGTGDIYYDEAGSLVIDGEVMKYTRASDVFTVVRAQNNTVAAKHDKKAAVQQCLIYNAVPVGDVLYDLLTNVKYANLPLTYIDKAAWDLETSVWLSQCNLTTCIPKPVGINTLITEILQQCLLYIWWDERSELIQLRAIRPSRVTETISIDETNNIIAGSTSITDTPEDRLSQVYVYFGQIDPTLDIARLDNYAFNNWYVDPSAEDVSEYGEQRISTIASRWFNDDNFPQAQSLGFRMLQRYRDNPKQMALSIDAKDNDIWTGSFISVQSQIFQDMYGDTPSMPMEVLSIEEQAGNIFQLTCVLSVFTKRYGFISPNGEAVYTSASDADKNLYAWASENVVGSADPVMSNGDSAYYII
jgi:hypothetical protein